MWNPAQTGSRLGASRKPTRASASASQTARLHASPFLLCKLRQVVVAPVVAPAKILRAARCRSVPQVRSPQTLLDTGFQLMNPLCAEVCRTLPNRAENALFFMGFKRSRVQISPAQFFEIISDMVLAHALVKLSDVRSNTAPMMQSRDRGASSAPEKTRLRLAAHQLGGPLLPEPQSPPASPLASERPPRRRPWLLELCAPRLPAPARHRSPRARILRRAFGNGCRFSARASESGCPSVNSRRPHAFRHGNCNVNSSRYSAAACSRSF